MDRVITALRTFLTLALPYFRSEEKWRARGLLLGVIAGELGFVAVAVTVIQWNARFFNALEARDWEAFKREGIRVPYPVREIRVRGGALPVETTVEVPS